MSEPTVQVRQSYLIIFDGKDDAICSAGELMMSHGAPIEWVPDVYSAMAQLCTGNRPNHLLVDVRILDDGELSFLNLAPRYFPDLKVTVPVFAGTLDRLNGVKGRYQTASLQDITDEAMGIRAAVEADVEDEGEVVEWSGEELLDTDVEVADAFDVAADRSRTLDVDPESEESIHGGASAEWPPQDAFHPADARIADSGSDTDTGEQPEDARSTQDADSGPLDRSRLSTDGGAESADAGMPLHEAVRRRMGGEPNPIGRRLPPGSMAFSGGASSSAPEHRTDVDRDVAITPEEIEALLRTDADLTEEDGGEVER
ncbi:MAG: hypothetical protein KF841_13655 [Phycisphaerae bacterium]|nr:hypothetical protein [Phycisphaerae bacterium]